MVAYSFKKRFVDPIRRGLVSAYPDREGIRPKRQTIRAIGKRRHARPGETLQLYCGLRTKHCFSIGVARCTEIVPVSIFVYPDRLGIKCGDETIPSWQEDRAEANAFARADGFPDMEEMAAFWLTEHGGGKFEGVLIKWEPL
jgi:hypothetical protein